MASAGLARFSISLWSIQPRSSTSLLRKMPYFASALLSAMMRPRASVIIISVVSTGRLVSTAALPLAFVVPGEAGEPREGRRFVHEVFQHRRVVVILVLRDLQQRALRAEFAILPHVAFELVNRVLAARVYV